LYHWGKRWIGPILRGYHRMEVIHQERIPMEEGYVLIANHQNFMDPFYVGAILPHQPFFMAKQEAFDHWILGRILRAFQAFPVRRAEHDVKAMKQALRILKEGKVLGMFPEGGRRDEKHFDDLKLGSAFFAKKANRPVVPIYIAGAEKALPKQNGWPKPVKIRFYIGDILYPEHYDDYKIMSEDINTVLTQLKEEADSTNN
jgi:1-acyl-sn-glycerol-3-phosphate acyltransferase